MRRLLMILMLMLMPLQLSWAAVASYCQHETGVAASHIGHHEHEHQANAVEPDPDNAKSLGTLDADCGFCHACGATIVSSIRDVSQISVVSRFATRHHDRAGSAFLSRPERPNWAALALFGETV